MAGYDRHRAGGLDPLAAMEQAAPLFARHPAPRPGDHPAGRLALTATGEPDDDATSPSARPRRSPDKALTGVPPRNGQPPGRPGSRDDPPASEPGAPADGG